MTTTDPTAIDLDALKVKLRRGPLKTYDTLPLIAAVAALRGRVVDLENDNIDSYEKFQLAAAKAIAAAARLAALSATPAEALEGAMAMREALNGLIEEKADYMRLNNLGDPETQHTIKTGRAALGSDYPYLLDLAAKDREGLQAEIQEQRDALTRLVNIIKAAGLDNLSRSVQLGATSWYVKASDALRYAESVLSDSERSGEADG